MNLYQYWRSWSFIHLDSIFSNFFSLETARPIEAKFHMDPSWDGGTTVSSNDPGHMTKMAAMPIYGKNMKNSTVVYDIKVGRCSQLNEYMKLMSTKG